MDGIAVGELLGMYNVYCLEKCKDFQVLLIGKSIERNDMLGMDPGYLCRGLGLYEEGSFRQWVRPIDNTINALTNVH